MNLQGSFVSVKLHAKDLGEGSVPPCSCLFLSFYPTRERGDSHRRPLGLSLGLGSTLICAEVRF